MNEVHSVLHRMNELATQAANDTNTSVDRKAIKSEIDQLGAEIDRISSATQFNTMNLIDGSFTNRNLQIGALSNQGVLLDIKAMDAHALGLAFVFDNPSEIDTILESKPSIEFIEFGGDETRTAYEIWRAFDKNDPTKKSHYNPEQCLFIDSFENAGRTMKLVQNAVDVVSQMRSSLGALQNRLEHTIANLDNISENTTSAESRIRDTDMAQEMVTYSTNNILMQAGQSVLAQANQNPQGILSILQ